MTALNMTNRRVPRPARAARTQHKALSRILGLHRNSKAAERLNTTGLVARRAQGLVPVGTRSIQVLIRLVRTEGTYNDGYVDDLLLVLTR